MSLADDIAWKIQRFTKEKLKNFEDSHDESQPFDSADVSFEVPGLVPVSRVFVASQLMAATWLFKTFPEVLKEQIKDAVTKVTGRIVAKRAAALALKEAGGATIVGQLFAGAFEEVTLTVGARNVEKLIRETCAKIRSDFNGTVLPRTSRPKKTRNVRTRHGAPGRAGRPRTRRREIVQAAGPVPEFGPHNPFVSEAATATPPSENPKDYAD